MSKSPKKKASSSSLVSSSQGQSPKKEASSPLASASEGPGDAKKSHFFFWPEWTDAEVNAEKWDAAKASKDVKLFDDPEGQVELPASLRVHTWKRPSEYIVIKTPVVVENEAAFDLTSANEHLLSSELMRWIISEIYILWNVCNTEKGMPVSIEAVSNPWRPWEHIFSLCKAVKGHMPLFNAYGKYVIKLYWMGSWRKITVDDMLPFDKDNNLLLPATTNQSELWPMLLAKGILKVASTDISVSGSGRELGEFTVIHCLTGWIAEIIPLKSWFTGNIWEFLRGNIAQFQLEEERSEEKTTTADLTTVMDSNVDEINCESPTTPKSKATGLTPTPLMVVCASYQPLHLLEKRTSVLTKMADSSESLRQVGLSQLYSHPVLLNRTRDCPLVAPPKPPPVPNWKLVRPRKQTNITDEPKETPIQKPEQFIEVSSPFINFKLMTMAAHDMEQGVVRRTGYNSNLTSFSEMDDGEDDHTQNDIIQNSLNTLDATETSQVTAEDKKKDDSIASDKVGVETSSNPEKETEGTDKQRVQTAKESNSALLQSHDALASEKPLLQETWVDLLNFTKCFQTLLIFHNPNTYTHQCKMSHFKNSISSQLSATALSNAVASTHSVSTPARQPDSTGTIHTESADHFLFVDNLLPTEIVICFSALVHWGESAEEKRESSTRPGSLTAKPFSWKSIVSELPVMQFQTTASKAALLSLPPGRHVLHIHTRALFAIHLHLCCMSPFVFGDEETVMPHLDKESLRFCEQAVMILRALGRVVGCFSDPEELPLATKDLERTHGVGIQQQRVFNEAVYQMFCSALGRKLTSEELFAVQTLTGDPSHHCSNNKATDARPDDTPKGWNGRQATDQEMQAATVLQAGWKGYLVREILTAARPGTKENLTVTKTLQEMWAPVESDIEKHAVFLLRHMVTNGEGIAEGYPCREDECNRITFTDYSVPIPEVANSWILIFREVFHVPKDMLLVPKIFSPLPICVVHVINNDTLEEIPRVFNRVEPHIYTPNKAGYTFVAEAHSGDTSVIGGKWRMRLIGSREPLPQLARDTPSNNFSVKELKGYYIPNEKNIICRHVVKVSSDHNATVQFQTSKSDVYIKLTILDHEKEIASNQGKGHAIIPVYCFLASNGSSVAQAGARQDQGSLTAEGRVTGGGGGKEGSDQHPTGTLFHKYYVQAEVLQKSWPLDDSLNSFIQKLRDIERNEMKVFGDILEDTSEPVGMDQQKMDSQKSTLKSHKAKEREKDKDKLTKSNSSIDQILDVSKPHWTLRVVSEHSETDSIEVKKDTERLEEIRAMKLAWEAAEPGRAAKAHQTRLRYLKQLESHTGNTAEGQELVTAEAASVGTQPQTQQSGDFSVLSQNFGKNDIDYTPFIRRSLPKPRLKDEVLEEEQRRECSEKFQSFRLIWDNILEQRQQERITRKEMMKRHVETYIGFQDIVDDYRQKLMHAREAFCSGILEEQSHKKKDELPVEPVEQEKFDPTQAQPSGRKSGNKKK
ncbi:androglobin-like isoform X2 [Xyrauchen texanus]|uniref:androglobin-like isoform X2 n=1 Tax=Xyrauchen texanus TaxID=154827 RepID=UPI0022422EC6|nr:androglobin-like isoform X2 [Xyrauchen texanus]